jgi:hypothetical protein
MNPLVSMIASQLGGPVVNQISQQIGADSGSTQSAINTALPMLLSAMGNHGNADELQQEAQNQGGVIDDVMGFLGNSQAGGLGGMLLNQFMGGNQNAIANLVGQQSGLSSGSAMQLLGILTPIVMGALGKSSAGGDANGLSQMLGAAASSSGGNDLLGAATKMLDSDGDGNVMEEIGGLLKKFI